MQNVGNVDLFSVSLTTMQERISWKTNATVAVALALLTPKVVAGVVSDGMVAECVFLRLRAILLRVIIL